MLRSNHQQFSQDQSSSIETIDYQPSNQTEPRESLHGRQINVKNLNSSTTWQEVKDLFRNAGNVIRVNVINQNHSYTDANGLFATVLFTSGKEAQRAIQMFNNHLFKGNQIIVSIDQSLQIIAKRSNYMIIPSEILLLPDHLKPKQVWVSNIPFVVGWQDLKDLFREAGTVVRADLKIDSITQKQRGQGIVLYSSWQEAVKSVNLFNGFVWFGRRIEVCLDGLSHLPDFSHQSTISYQSGHQSVEFLQQSDYSNINQQLIQTKPPIWEEVLYGSRRQLNHHSNNQTIPNYSSRQDKQLSTSIKSQLSTSLPSQLNHFTRWSNQFETSKDSQQRKKSLPTPIGPPKKNI